MGKEFKFGFEKFSVELVDESLLLIIETILERLEEIEDRRDSYELVEFELGIMLNLKVGRLERRFLLVFWRS